MASPVVTPSVFGVPVLIGAAWTMTASAGAGINPIPVPVPFVLGGGIYQVPYMEALSADGGTGPYVWAVSAGTLPTGLTLNPSNGAIQGTPTVVGTFSFTVRITDSNGNIGAIPYSITISTPPLSPSQLNFAWAS